MKQQFLDLNGLTELVTYLKKSITEQKEILPYASNKLFPSTGNVNTIYIDTATNSIAEGCSWCTAYNYQVFGTPDARATFICVMHKARALGNIYFWNKYYRKHNMSTRMKMHIPDEWALEIISQSELDMLKELSKEDA